MAVVEEASWNFSDAVVYFSSKSWAFIKNHSDKELLLQRMLSSVADVLLDVGHLSTIIRRDLKKRMGPLEFAALPINHQVRLDETFR